jgi:dihydroflavonol-4-reductase
LVDARDVAEAHLLALEKGRRGERYLAAGRHLTMRELFAVLERVSGVKAPTRALPLPALYGIAAFAELAAWITKKPALLSLATVRLMRRENDRTRFDPAKAQRELGLRFRPVEETLADELAWFRAQGLLPA